MKIITDKISRSELKELMQKMFGNFVKAVVDINKKIMVIDADLHSDEESLLLQNESKQEDLWGINLYPEIDSEDWIEFDSMINLRPSQNNRSRGVDSPEIRKIIIEIVNSLVQR